MNRLASTLLFLLSLLFPFFIFSQNDPFNPLFSKTALTETSEQATLLAPLEKRATLARLNASADGKIDLSGSILFNLFDDVEYPVQLHRKAGEFYEDMEVWTGRLPDERFDHIPHYINAVVVVNPRTRKMVANLHTRKGYFQILPTATAGVYRVRDCKDDPVNCQLLEPEAQHPSELSLEERSVCGSACLNETDANGKYVIDMFIGFSNSAASVAGDINAYAQAMVTSVNTGLSNSQVTTTYMRLVGTGTTPNNPGVVTSVLSDVYTWFAADLENTAADMVSVFQTLTGAPGEAGGWAGVGGYSSVNNIVQPNAFRHEIGHNVGGGHCPGDGSVFTYAHGYNNGNWRTHLCGNDVNFYSNPAINDNLGQPIGNAATADMARTWRERAAEISRRRLHRIPYYSGDACVNQICIPSHWGGQVELIRRVVFNTLDNNQGTPDWNCPSITGYSDYTNLNTTIRRGSTYTMTVTPNFSWDDSKLGAWIDWDNNGILDGSERMVNLSGAGPWSRAITVPTDAALGPTRLRIRLQYGPSYVPDPCDGSSYSSGESEDYTVTIAAALPVALINFQGKTETFGNLLTWRTAQEINTDHFEIERSPDGRAFISIGRETAKGAASSYSFTDRTPVKELSYYRLKIVDRDGSVQYSNIIFIGEKESNGFTIYPNPAHDELTLQTERALQSGLQVSFWNTLGQKMLEFSENDASQTTSWQIDVSALPAGVYHCRVSDEEKVQAVLKVVKR